jgi:hypothetical protein
MMRKLIISDGMSSIKGFHSLDDFVLCGVEDGKLELEECGRKVIAV